MAILLLSKRRDFSKLKEAIFKIDPNIDVDIWPAIEHKDRINLVVSWLHPKQIISKLPNVKAVMSYGAGVDHLIEDDELKDLKITRCVTPKLGDQLADYVLMSLLNYELGTQSYLRKQLQAEWKPSRRKQKSDLTIGILGLGHMGKSIAEKLIQNGYHVYGWSRSHKDIAGLIKSFSQDDYEDFLSHCNVLVCTLPLTPETDGILDLDTFKKIKNPAYIINIGRGNQLIEEDLLYAIDTGLIEGATLDVFSQEPLPENHQFWSREQITITPHIASWTNEDEAAELIVENYKRLTSGHALKFEVDRKKDY